MIIGGCESLWSQDFLDLAVALLPDFLKLRQESSDDLWHIALGMDIRERSFLESYPRIFSELRQGGTDLEIVFLEATDEDLQRRFSQTRRKHPLVGEGTVLDRIKAERQSLKDLKGMATRVIDTSNLNVHELKRMISRLYTVYPAQDTLHVNVLSFGFKYGVFIFRVQIRCTDGGRHHYGCKISAQSFLCQGA
jgi:UPF0042 nucleotide-binding protein